MIICDKTCGEEASPGGAARTLWRRVEWGPGPSRRGADGLAGEGRVLPARRRTRAATSRARGRSAAAARGARPAAGDGRVGAPSVPHDAVERGWPLGTIGHVAARLGRIETPLPAEHRGHYGASASRRPPVLLPPPLRSEHGGRGRTRRSPCDHAAAARAPRAAGSTQERLALTMSTAIPPHGRI